MMQVVATAALVVSVLVGTVSVLVGTVLVLVGTDGSWFPCRKNVQVLGQNSFAIYRCNLVVQIAYNASVQYITANEI